LTAVFKKSLPYALAHLCMGALQWMSMLYLPLYFQAQGFDGSAIGALVSLFSLATLALVFPLGVLSDRLPPHRLIYGGALLAILAAGLMARHTGFCSLAAGTFLMGAGFTLSWISLYSVFFKQIEGKQRGVEVSIFNIGGIMGAGLGACLCGELTEAFRPAVIFALAAAFALAWSLANVFLPKTRGISFPIMEYARDLKRPRTWVLVGIFFIAASHAGFEHAGYTLLQTEVIGLSADMVGKLFLVLAAWMSIITLATGRMHDKRERPLIMMAFGLILSGTFMAASGSAGGALDFLLYRVLHTAGDSVLSLLILVAASMIFPRRRSGGAFAFALTVNTASYFMFANLAGAVGERFGFDSAFHLSGAIEIAGGLALLLLRKKIRAAFLQDGAGQVQTSPGVM